MTPLPVTVLSGFLGAGKTTVLRHILHNQHEWRIALIVNDMSEINIDSRLVRQGQTSLNHVDERLIEMTNGCICCTLREDLLVEIGRLAREQRFDYLLVESTGISEPLSVAETFTFAGEDGQSLSNVARLDTMVTVVDAFNFLDDYIMAEYLHERGLQADNEDERTITDLLIEQIEFANVILLNKCDLVESEKLNQLEHLLRSLNPEARLLRSERGQVPLDQLLHTGLFNFEQASRAAGWLKELRGEHVPETEEYGVSSFVYRSRRPFHPQRFWDLVHEEWAGVLRSKGFFWLASRMNDLGIWSQAGGASSVEPGGSWWASVPEEEWPDSPEERAWILNDWRDPVGDRRQELVLIGAGMDRDALTESLDACVLTDDEMSQGPDAWAKLPDPFPAW